MLYFGLIDASDGVELEVDIPGDRMLCKLGVSSDIQSRNGSHESGRQFPNFRIVHVVKADSRSDVAALEKHTKRVVSQMGLKLKYGSAKECFAATEEQLQQVIDQANDFVSNGSRVKDDTRVEIRRIELEELEIRDRSEARLVTLFSDGKISYSQLRELLGRN